MWRHDEQLLRRGPAVGIVGTCCRPTKFRSSKRGSEFEGDLKSFHTGDTGGRSSAAYQRFSRGVRTKVLPAMNVVKSARWIEGIAAASPALVADSGRAPRPMRIGCSCRDGMPSSTDPSRNFDRSSKSSGR